MEEERVWPAASATSQPSAPPSVSTSYKVVVTDGPAAATAAEVLLPQASVSSPSAWPLRSEVGA